MKKLLLVLSTTLLSVIAGCGATVQTYTFEVERTDQEIAGNRGYVGGAVPEAGSRVTPTRTWVGVDIELPTREEFVDETGLKVHK